VTELPAVLGRVSDNSCRLRDQEPATGQRTYDFSVRRAWVVVASVLFAAGVFLAIAPFSPVGARPGVVFADGDISWRCSAPIASAWRADRFDTGWFGYAPLALAGEKEVPWVPCRRRARQRLAIAASLVVGGGVVFVRRPRRGART
jgi:hypothetical protein